MAASIGHPLTPRHLQRERLRLAVAITLSALVHLWFAGGVPLRKSGQAPSRSPAIISVQLQMPEALPDALSPPQDNAKVVHERVPDSRRRIRPADEGARKTASDKLSAATISGAAPDAPVAADALPQVSDPMYYPANRLDVYPALIQPVNLDDLRHAANDNVGGRALLMLLIDENGSVRAVSIVEPGPVGLFERTLRTAFSAARFSPARKDGRAVKSRVVISVDYQEFVGLGPDKLLK